MAFPSINWRIQHPYGRSVSVLYRLFQLGRKSRKVRLNSSAAFPVTQDEVPGAVRTSRWIIGRDGAPLFHEIVAHFDAAVNRFESLLPVKITHRSDSQTPTLANPEASTSCFGFRQGEPKIGRPASARARDGRFAFSRFPVFEWASSAASWFILFSFVSLSCFAIPVDREHASRQRDAGWNCRRT